MQQVLIRKGSYRDERARVHTLQNQQVTLVRPWSPARGGQVLAQCAGLRADTDVLSIRVAEADVLCTDAPAAPEPAETLTQAIERIRTRFQIVDQMTDAVALGQVRGLIISGPPGVGKSHTVEQILDTYEAEARLQGRTRTEVVKGNMSPIGLYKTLYNNATPGSILVLDDADSILFDDTALNMLKAVLDTGDRRRVSWKAESRILKEEGIPDSFDFKGGIIFITNLDFSNVKSKRLQDHLAALVSRCHYIDLEMTSEADCFIRIQQIMQDGLLQNHNLPESAGAEILEFMQQNSLRLREISLRQVIKIADLMRISELNWRSLAENTCLTR
jgi:hypothetical protein